MNVRSVACPSNACVLVRFRNLHVEFFLGRVGSVEPHVLNHPIDDGVKLTRGIGMPRNGRLCPFATTIQEVIRMASITSAKRKAGILVLTFSVMNLRPHYPISHRHFRFSILRPHHSGVRCLHIVGSVLQDIPGFVVTFHHAYLLLSVVRTPSAGIVRPFFKEVHCCHHFSAFVLVVTEVGPSVLRSAFQFSQVHLSQRHVVGREANCLGIFHGRLQFVFEVGVGREPKFNAFVGKCCCTSIPCISREAEVKDMAQVCAVPFDGKRVGIAHVACR